MTKKRHVASFRVAVPHVNMHCVTHIALFTISFQHITDITACWLKPGLQYDADTDADVDCEIEMNPTPASVSSATSKDAASIKAG